MRNLRQRRPPHRQAWDSVGIGTRAGPLRALRRSAGEAPPGPRQGTDPSQNQSRLSNTGTSTGTHSTISDLLRRWKIR